MTYTPTNCEFCKRLLKTENGFNNHKCPQKNKPKAPTTYKCEFCKKTFKTEGGMTKHMCFRKIRWMNKESQETRIATSIWTLFREIIRMPIKSGSSHDIEFIKSKEYADFIKFASYIIETKPLNYMAYATRLIHERVPSRRWCSDELHKNWTIEYMKAEGPNPAITRTMENITRWAESTDNNWVDFLECASVSRIFDMLERGRISPWFFYIREGSNKFISRCSDEEIITLQSYLNPSVWKTKIYNNKLDVEQLTLLLNGE